MILLKKILLFFSARKFIEIINSGFGWQSAEQDTQGHGPGDATHLQERIRDLEDEIMDLEDELDDFYDDFDDIDE